jgi:hypothetical protein
MPFFPDKNETVETMLAKVLAGVQPWAIWIWIWVVRISTKYSNFEK